MAGHIGPALRMDVVDVYHTPRLGGGQYRAGADRVVRPYELLCPGAIQPDAAIDTPCWRHTQVPPYGEGASFLRRAGPMCPALPVGGIAEGRGNA